MRRNDDVCIHNDERTWATWDHYLIVATIQEEELTKNCEGKENEEVDWMETKTDEQTMKIRQKGDGKER